MVADSKHTFPQSNRDVTLISPLRTLRHYSEAVAALCGQTGRRCRIENLDEPSASGHGRMSWLRCYLGRLCANRRLAAQQLVIVTWPVLGYWDFLLLRVLTGPGTWLVMHDPKPLVKALGYGRVARAIAGSRWVDARVIVHSELAYRAVTSETVLRRVVLLPHPMKRPAKPAHRAIPAAVRVIGQYKADRDIDVLVHIAEQAPRVTPVYEIYGRGWPQVPGWLVTSEFLDERSFAKVIAESSVVLIPYKRFFQSGVALRCLESATPVVGPRDSSLVEILGSGSSWLVDGDDWDRAINAALQASEGEIAAIAGAAFGRVADGWAMWLETAALSAATR